MVYGMFQPQEFISPGRPEGHRPEARGAVGRALLGVSCRKQTRSAGACPFWIQQPLFWWLLG